MVLMHRELKNDRAGEQSDAVESHRYIYSLILIQKRMIQNIHYVQSRIITFDVQQRTLII